MQAELQRVLELQPSWTWRKTVEMDERGKLVRNEVSGWLRDKGDRLATSVGIQVGDFFPEGRDGTGRKPECHGRASARANSRQVRRTASMSCISGRSTATRPAHRGRARLAGWRRASARPGRVGAPARWSPRGRASALPGTPPRSRRSGSGSSGRVRRARAAALGRVREVGNGTRGPRPPAGGGVGNLPGGVDTVSERGHARRPGVDLEVGAKNPGGEVFRRGDSERGSVEFPRFRLKARCLDALARYALGDRGGERKELVPGTSPVRS